MFNTEVKNSSLSLTLQQRAVAVTLAASLGLFMVWGIGFAQSQTLHDAAHDTRHSFTFPCH